MPPSPIKPKNYFLNENHELSIGEKGGGGRQVEILNINWSQRSQRLSSSLQRVSQRSRQSRDPLSKQRYYLIADPFPEIAKASTAKDATRGQKLNVVVFSGEHSKLFERIGLDLIEVHPSGVPEVGYPAHFNNPGWELHTWPRAFNALTCGGIAARLSAGGLATEVDAPSPFTRVGPGFAKSPKPDFCAPAGNSDANYRQLQGSGVWGFSALGNATEACGTSYAAPLLAREAAFLFEELRPKCPGESRPFACAVKAVMALTADDVTKNLSNTLQPLAKRTVGFGRADTGRFRQPNPQRARFVWQGVIAHEDDVVRIQLPIPTAWIDKSKSPQLQLCVAWDTPVCAAAKEEWSCRDVKISIRPGEEAQAANGTRRKVPGYPLFKRSWNLTTSLAKAREKNVAITNFWILEFSYSQNAAYAAGHTVSPSQRIAFAAEIWDESDTPSEPHSFIQSLPIASTLIRLSNTSAWLPNAISITSDV